MGIGKPGGWYPDPSLEGRMRYWDGAVWTPHVSLNGEQYQEPYLGEGQVRWQYGVVNLGSYGAAQRMQATLAAAGEQGWQLVTIYDKASNWMNGMEKGFMMLKRPVPPGVRLADDDWCVNITLAGGYSKPPAPPVTR